MNIMETRVVVTMEARVVVTARREGKQRFMIQRLLTWAAVIPVLFVLQQFIRFCT